MIYEIGPALTPLGVCFALATEKLGFLGDKVLRRRVIESSALEGDAMEASGTDRSEWILHRRDMYNVDN